MFTHRYNKRVRYGETDQMGYLYYGIYANYFEIGRVEMIRSLGLPYKVLEEELGVMMPVTSIDIRYVRPALYDELLTIETTLKQLPGKIITFHVDILNEGDKLVARGKVNLCFVDIESRSKVNPPEALLSKLRPYFEEV